MSTNPAPAAAVTILQLTPDDLRREVREAVSEALAAVESRHAHELDSLRRELDSLRPPALTTRDIRALSHGDWLPATTTARLLGVSFKTLKRHAAEAGLSPNLAGKYRKSEVEALRNQPFGARPRHRSRGGL